MEIEQKIEIEHSVFLQNVRHARSSAKQKKKGGTWSASGVLSRPDPHDSRRHHDDIPNTASLLNIHNTFVFRKQKLMAEVLSTCLLFE